MKTKMARPAYWPGHPLLDGSLIMTAFRGSLLAAIVLFAGGAVQAQGLKTGTDYRGSVQISRGIGAILLPLPAGAWRLTDLKKTPVAGVGYKVPVESGVLVSLDLDQKTNQVKSLISYWQTPINSEHAGWEELSVCNDTDQYSVFKSDQNQPHQQIRCWGIKLQSVKASRLIPEFLIGVTFFWSQETRALHATYFFNPQADGFAPVTLQDWSKGGVAADPRKAKYVEDLKTWATAWQPKIEQGFAGKQP
jgi:hypothetical protein